ncbi:hypothetical protein DC094_19580 [Pelagibaculum spongiae]|uniref:Uncharacterized protein n=1 Tax=Pelagibaculum spongiae TaxID=2080658 RepID=A0A2V1GS14_9GAMM|nr:hypothetical protein DC094_19580 [Pelagibaculum spongiae]
MLHHQASLGCPHHVRWLLSKKFLRRCDYLIFEKDSNKKKITEGGPICGHWWMVVANFKFAVAILNFEKIVDMEISLYFVISAISRYRASSPLSCTTELSEKRLLLGSRVLVK